MANALDRVKAAEAKYAALVGTAEKLEATLKKFTGDRGHCAIRPCIALQREIKFRAEEDQKDRALGFLVARVGGRDGGLHHGFPWKFSTGGGCARS